MWPGQQPPGGEQNPQDQNQNPNAGGTPQQGQNPPVPGGTPAPGPNPYQQPGYQQPNPYQQPGYQQTPYPPQPGQSGQPGQWGAPTVTMGSKPPGNDRKKTTIVAIVAATAVVVATAVTGFVVFGGDDGKKDEADGKPTPAASAEKSGEPAEKEPSEKPANPRDGSNGEQPTIAGWTAVVNPRFGTVFDVPEEWELESTDTSLGFEWEKEDGEWDRTTVTAPAVLKPKWCTDDEDKDGTTSDTSLAAVGTRGENGAKDTDEAAVTRVPWWIFGGYTQPDKKSVKQTKPKPYTTKSGLKGSVITAHSENTPQKGKCASDGKAITFAFQNGAGDFVTWNLYGAKGVKDELAEDTIQKILSTVRLTKDDPTE